MKKHYRLILLVLGLIIHQQGIGQIVITSPTDRVVYQRDASNQFSLDIHGYVQACVESVEYRLIPISSRDGGPALGTPAPATGWKTVEQSNICSNFSSKITLNGGWYRLEIRTLNNGTVSATAAVAHVGVGEVFVVAGQSNATGGDSNISGPGATEDAVSSVNFQNLPIHPYSDVQLPCPEYVHLDQFTKTAPFGNYAWCWGSFGDKMVQKLGVPVMIFNTGWSSTGVWNWKESIDHQNPIPSITYWGYAFPSGLPFGHLRLALNNYIAQLGVRAVLWHQGESDNAAGRSQTQYYTDLRAVIEASRSLSGKPALPWVVAQASRFTVDGVSRTWPPVIAAQQAIAGQGLSAEAVPVVFPGPQTDSYYAPEYRSDGIHFSGSGLQTLAQLWADRLDATFFQNATPYLPLSSPTLSTQNSGTSIQYTASMGWNEYAWLPDGECHIPMATTNTVTPGPGLFRLKSTDNNQNVVYSPMYFIPSNALPVRLAYFGAEPSEKNIRIHWTTAEEVNVDHFEVQRSTDLQTFTTITQIPAQGFSSREVKYDYFDRDLAGGQYYYRLKSVDLDQSWSYSSLVTAKIDGEQQLIAYPNPATDHINIQSNALNQPIEIYNSSGQIIKQFNLKTPTQKIDLNTIAPGLYTIRMGHQTYNFIKTTY